MDNLLMLLPAAALILGALVLVWRGMRRKPDDTANTARGGGPGDGGGD